ncbi:hypothetical protein ACH42_02060 [Endozoicomonas sp. (ex Bugula neritina AB1)]|nr:hypothetical protein ACH42_02060 [Endozoicomonas sp. (ex Bugula neritina AB1)]
MCKVNGYSPVSLHFYSDNIEEKVDEPSIGSVEHTSVYIPTRPPGPLKSSPPVISREVLDAKTVNDLIVLEEPEYSLPKNIFKSSGKKIAEKLKSPFLWLKHLTQNLCSYLFSKSGASKVKPEDVKGYSEALPEACEKVVADGRNQLINVLELWEGRLQTTGEVYKPFGEEQPASQDVLTSKNMESVLVEDEGEFFDAVEVQPKVQEEEVILDAFTGLPMKELEERVLSGVSKIGSLLSPVGRAAKSVTKKCISEERLEKLEVTLKSGVKERVKYEVEENNGRRMAQLMSVVGSASPAIPVMIGLARIKDAKNHLSALYHDGNVKPLLTDLAMTCGPIVIGRLLTVAAQ